MADTVEAPMRPTYEQLVALNPLLGKKTREEFEQLVDIFEEYGYFWDANQKIFFNKNNLGGFQHEAVAFYGHKELKKKLRVIVSSEIYGKVWEVGILKMVFVTAIWIIGGWIFVSISTWLLVMAGLVLLLFMFHIVMNNPPSWFPIPNRWKEGNPVNLTDLKRK